MTSVPAGTPVCIHQVINGYGRFEMVWALQNGNSVSSNSQSHRFVAGGRFTGKGCSSFPANTVVGYFHK